MAVSVSAITYLRGVFPEKAYGERNLCGKFHLSICIMDDFSSTLFLNYHANVKITYDV